MAALAVLVGAVYGRGDEPGDLSAWTVDTEGRAQAGVTQQNLAVGASVGRWTYLGATKHAGVAAAVLEDFSSTHGELVLLGPTGVLARWGKPLEPTFLVGAPYRGHTLAEVKGSDRDLLGEEILAQAGDPRYAEVERCFPPITKVPTYTFVGTPTNADKVGIEYGGRTPTFDPAVFVPEVRRIREAGHVWEGLVGGWLPVSRFVYPEGDAAWTEFMAFAPFRRDEDNARVQPVWYRVARVEHGALRWVKYFDSSLPFPPRMEPARPEAFYADLARAAATWSDTLSTAMQIELPDRRLADQARHSLVRAMMTRIDGYPKYGVLDRNYGAAEHDGFQDTFNVDTTAMLEWGLFDEARKIIDNYFTHFVRADGSILYRGPETGQYGRMLTVLAEYYQLTGDHELLLRHRAKIEAVTTVLLELRRAALRLPAEHPARGIPAGWCEADSCIDPDPERYRLPFFSNACEAARGFAELGSAWQQIGRAAGRSEIAARGDELVREAAALQIDLERAIERTRLASAAPVCLPVIAGATEPPHVAAARDSYDPQFRAYRAYMEMLFSGRLPARDADEVLNYRAAHRDLILGVPTAYGFNSTEFAGFLSYGYGFGLLQRDRIREFLLQLYSLSAHQYTRGSWTAPETRRIDPKDYAAPYCVPAQLTVPLHLRWLLAWEEPGTETLWLARAVPREWLADGQRVACAGVPTRWGRFGFEIESRIATGLITARVTLPPSAERAAVKLRLRLPNEAKIRAVKLDGADWTQFDAADETILLPKGRSGRLELLVRCD